MRRWNSRVSYFLSFVVSILRYSSTSSIGVSSFFFDVLGVLFLVVSLQGSKGLFIFGFWLKKGSTGFVSPGGTMYGTQSEILICGNDTFFLFETVFIAQSKTLLHVSYTIRPVLVPLFYFTSPFFIYFS